MAGLWMWIELQNNLMGHRLFSLDLNPSHRRPIGPITEPTKTRRNGVVLVSLPLTNPTWRGASRENEESRERERERERWAWLQQQGTSLGEQRRRRGFGSCTGKLSRTSSTGPSIATSSTKMYSLTIMIVILHNLFHFQSDLVEISVRLTFDLFNLWFFSVSGFRAPRAFWRQQTRGSFSSNFCFYLSVHSLFLYKNWYV
jgi:hypothetical protein